MIELPKANLNGSFTYLPIEDTHFGEGSIEKLATALDAQGVSRAVVITGNTLARTSDAMDAVLGALGPRCAGVFSETVQHVPREGVLAAADFARSKGADGIVSFGGGSPNDTAKAVLLALAEGFETVDDFDRLRIKFEYPDKIEIPAMTNSAVPLFAVPTTLSAGEFTHFIGITDEKRKVKDLYIDKRLMAKAVILDPLLTRYTPEWLWLSSGIRSVDHAVEAICSSTAQPFTDALGYRALNMLFRYLPECRRDPEDMAARVNCQVAAWLSISGLASVTLGLSHGIGHQLGARCNVPHGQTSCVMLHNVMEFNRAETLVRQAWISQAIGAARPGMSTEEMAEAAQEGVLRLIRDDLGLPWRLRDVGVAEADFGAIAADAMQDLIVATNPRPVTSQDEVVTLLKQAY